MTKISPAMLKMKLDTLYNTYNRRCHVHPDPLEFLFNFKNLKDREIVGMIAACLAYGRVAQILKSVSHVLTVIGSSPFYYLKQTAFCSLQKDFDGFKHRFATGYHLSSLLWSIKQMIAKYGSLYECFLGGVNKNDRTILPALTIFAETITVTAKYTPGHLMPLPARGSACKRLNLFLRWMVRKDNVDPGGWEQVPVSKLIIPLDIHMHRVGIALGLTERKHADMRAALEITERFKEMIPEDPVRYDFALTRLGIKSDADLDAFLKSCGKI